MDLGGLIAGVVGGALAGKGADSTSAIPSPGGMASLASGGVGGLLGGLLTGNALDLGSQVGNIAGQLVGGGIAGTIVTAVVGMLLRKKA